jgi:hypothetical protein
MMSCCGQKRAAFAQASALRRLQPAAHPAPPANILPPLATDSVPLRYLGTAAIALRGAHTGRSYYFEASGIVVAVHSADAAALLNSQLFVREQG